MSNPTSEQMTPVAFEALKGSIAKWEAITAGTEDDLGQLNCPLCKIFFHPTRYYVSCDGCPVREATGKHSCDDTPYRAWVKFIANREGYDRDAKWRVTDAESRSYAQAELDFLKSLLPPGESP